MDTGEVIFLAVSFVLIFAYTAWNIASVRKTRRLYRQLHEILKQQQQRDEPPTEK